MKEEEIRHLDEFLNRWFGLKTSDIPKFLFFVGISGRYSMNIDEFSNSSVKLSISSDVKNYILKIIRGEMGNPYPVWCLLCDDGIVYYDVDENLNIEEIISFD